ATLGGVAALLGRQELVVLVAATAHRRAHREHARSAPRYFEVLVDTPADECARRDAKGLYAAARRGEIVGLPGQDAPFEPPVAPLVVARGGHDEVAIEALVAALEA